MIEFKLPWLGADMDQGELLEWMIKPGDRVRRGQVIAVVDTSKAAVEVESWQEGIVHALLAQPGDMLPVGAPMAQFLADGEVPPAVSVPVIAAPPAIVPTAGTLKPADTAGSAAIPAGALGDRKKISPAARRRAAELQIDPQTIELGSGPHGAVTIEDVERAAARARVPMAPAKKAPGSPADRAAEMRKTIAGAMSRSKREIPHYYLAQPIPLQRMTLWLSEQNALRSMDRRLLMAVPLLKAIAMTLEAFPELNGFYRDGEFKPSPQVQIGVAISLRHGGLIAPALHDIGAKSLDQLMQALGDLVQRTRAGSLRSSELSDATVTVTNLGEQGAEAVYGVISPPQVALVGLGRVSVRPWVVDGAVVALPVVTATLSADHRVSDGHRGARFLTALAEALQHPEKL